MTTTVSCRSCQRQSATYSRWSPVIINGEVRGYTCPKCPKWREPISRVVNGAGVRYRVRLSRGTTPTGRQVWHTKVFGELEDARTHVIAMRAQLQHETPLDRSKVTVDELADRWLDAKRGDVRPNTLETYERSLVPVRKHLGSKRAGALKVEHVNAFARWLPASAGRKGQGLGRHASRAALVALKAVLDYGVAERLLTQNVASKVKLPKTDSTATDALERWVAAEVMEFVRHTDEDRLAAAWRLICLGLRREELLGLDWGAVDFGAGTITIRQTRVKVSNSVDPRGWVLGEVKSAGSKHNASRRTLHPDAVLPGTMAALKALHLSAGRPARGLIVLDQMGVPVLPDTFSARFTALAKAAGVPQINVHSTRHSVAYLLHDAGVAPVRAAAFLGHRLDVHLSTYLFARDDDVQVAGTALGEALSKASAAS